MRRFVSRLCEMVNGGGMLLLLGMMLLLVAEVILANVFNRPIAASYEVVQFMLVTMVFFGIGYTALKGGHVAVDFVVSRLSKRAQVALETVTAALGLFIFVVIVWQSVEGAIYLRAKGETSYMLGIPTYPFYWIIAFGSALLAWTLILQFVDTFRTALESLSNRSLLIFYAITLITVGLLLAVSLHVVAWKMSPTMAGIVGIMLLLVLLAAGMPLGFAMALVGFLGYSYVVNVPAALSQVSKTTFAVGSDYLLSVLPLFILMGQFAFDSGISQDLYDVAYKWLGRLKGGLAHATIGACALFAAISGSSVATAAAMGTVSLPAMVKYKYHHKLALGSIGAGGTLGILIPPSLVFVLYGIMTEQSIGKLFISGILPAIVMTLLYMSAVVYMVRINPGFGPPGPSTTWSERFFSIYKIWGMLFLFLLVMGGMYVGWFTPTQAAAIGAFGALVVSLVKRRVTRKGLSSCLLETGKTTAMLVTIFIGAMIFNYFIAVTTLPMELAQWVTTSGLSRYAVLVLVLLLYLFLGCIMDSASMIILTIPIIYPLIQAMQFDPIWFGVIIVVTCEIGNLTPPVGLNIFVLQSIAPRVPVVDIYRGLFPFIVMAIIGMIILIIFPQISLFLPNLMAK
ncbi:MAG: TRAP transporter large permease subunit [Deltaproteobacteria bacterium]|nr:TRAP transporter large permease subunit [Deltaproteobacteria bacterium]